MWSCDDVADYFIKNWVIACNDSNVGFRSSTQPTE